MGELQPLRVGIDYDLVNISLIGHDPVTGRSYEECQDEWDRARDDLLARIEKLRWWQLTDRFRLVRQCAVLRQRLGMQ
jgi:hypothetical protein